MADITEPLKYGRLTGDFWAVLEDSADPDVAPDTIPLMGTVEFTPSNRILRVSSEDIAQRGVVYVDAVTAQVVNGVLVDDYGEPGVSLLASTEEDGDVFPHNISWTATFKLVMSSGAPLASQPEATKVRLAPGEIKPISDFIPAVLESGSGVRVISVDVETLQQVNNQVDYVDSLIEALGIAVEAGVVKGDTGEKGDQGDKGEIGPYGPPGRAGVTETYNYVKNPVPTSNEGYHAENGTVSYANNALTLVSSGTTDLTTVTWVRAVPTFPGTNMYLQFDANKNTSVDVQSTITFLNAELEPIDSETLVHAAGDEPSVPDEVVSDTLGTYSHMYYTDGPASFAIFSVGFSKQVPSGTSMDLSKFYFSDTLGSYFFGGDTRSGYNMRWLGLPNDSYSIMTPVVLSTGVTVSTVNGQQGDVIIDAGTLELGMVDNTSDLDKPISDATQEALDEKLNTDGLMAEITERDRNSEGFMALSEFSRYATQEVWRLPETFVDISHAIAPIGGESLIRMTIPGSITGNSPSSIPTVEQSSNGSDWSVWRTLTDTPPNGVSYTAIDGTYDRLSGTLKVVVRELSTAGSVTLHLFTVDNGGVVSSAILGTFTATTDPYLYPSITTTPANDGTLYLYYMDSTNITRRKTISAEGVLGTTRTNLTGMKTGAPAKVSKFYGTYVAATADNAVAGSPGLLISGDGVSWRSKGFSGTHTWDRGAQTKIMSAYPGVSRGKVGIFLEYIDSSGHKLNRLFATSSPSFSGTISGLSTEPSAITVLGADISFPGTLASTPVIHATSDDSRLNLGIIAVSRDGGTVERFNMGDAPSSNATITWTAIS